MAKALCRSFDGFARDKLLFGVLSFDIVEIFAKVFNWSKKSPDILLPDRANQGMIENTFSSAVSGTIYPLGANKYGKGY